MQFFLSMILFSSLSLVHSSTYTKVWGELHRAVILPCSFPPGNDVTIHWTHKDKENVAVHSYYDGKDQLGKQNSNYSGRTSLYLRELVNGNASLQLRNLKKSDAVNYLCYVGTTNMGSTEKNAELEVTDFNHSIEYMWNHQELHLGCYVNNPYPDDIVWIRWYIDNELVQENKTTKSDITVNNSSQSHQCNISHSLVTTTWTGKWERKENIVRGEDTLTCECSSCDISNIEFMAIYLIQNNTKQVIRELNSLSLSRFTWKDNGNYTCVKKTAEQMHIEMTVVNITEVSERSHIAFLVSLLFGILGVLGGIIIYFIKKRQGNHTESNQQQQPLNSQESQEIPCSSNEARYGTEAKEKQKPQNSQEAESDF